VKKLILLLTISAYSLSATTQKEIKFEGLTQISDELALETFNLSNDSTYTIESIDNAIKNFYKYKYFDDIWVSDENNTLTFHFKEKPFIAKIDMQGYKNREDELKELYTIMGIKKGTMYTPKKIEKAKKLLLLSLEREGYLRSVVETEIEKLNDTSVAVKFTVNKGDEIIIKKSLFKGVKKLPLSDIEAVIANKQADCCFTWFFGRNDGIMSLEQIEYDNMRIKDLYYQNGYLDAKVSKAYTKVDFDTNTASLEYTIVEGEQYKLNNTIINIDLNISKPNPMYPHLRLQQGDVFNIAKLRKDQEYIKTFIADKGYAFTEVKYNIKMNKEKHTVDLVYTVTPGEKVYINDVIISGNTRTLDRVIRRNIYLAPKDLYSLTDFKDSKNALKRTGFFDSVNIEQKRVSNSKMDLIVTVSEAATGNLTLGGGYGDYDGWMINASVSDKNILGSGLNLGLSFDYSQKRNTLNLSLSNPAIRDSIYSGSVNVYKKESIVESTDENTTFGDETTYTNGASVGIGRALGRHTRIGATYAIEDVKVEYDLNSTANSSYATSSITPYISFNNTDDYYVPRDGIIAGASYKKVTPSLGGDAKYSVASTYFKYFHSLERLLDKDWIFRYKTSVKVMIDEGEIPDGTTFYLGGVSSVRGYSSYAFQPEDDEEPFKKTWTNTMELSFPLIPSAKMRWALFYDYGMIGTNSFTEIQKSGRGVVISWYSPVGPLQFIFSRAVDPDETDNTSNFEFSLGSRF